MEQTLHVGKYADDDHDTTRPRPPDDRHSRDAVTGIRDLISPVGRGVSETHGLDAARRLIDRGADYVAVTDLRERTVGVLTRADLERFQNLDPLSWESKLCASAVADSERILRLSDSLQVAIEMLRVHGIRPLLVREGAFTVGILEPSAVFQWCAAHDQAVLNELAQRACSEEQDRGRQGADRTR